MQKRSDAAYKLLFSTPEIVRDLVSGFIDDPWLRSLDLGMLEKVPTEFTDRRLRRRTSDVIWRVRIEAGEGDPERLPPILPVVIYNGTSPWRAATEIGDLIAPVSAGLAPHMPRIRYLLIDQARFDEAQLSTMRNLMAAVMRLDRTTGREALLSAIADLRALVAGAPRVQEVFSAWSWGDRVLDAASLEEVFAD